MLHGESGEDGAVREVLDLLEIPYVGAGPAACRTAFDKPVAKSVVARVGITTPESVCLPHETFRELGAADLMDGRRRPTGATPHRQAGQERLGAGLLARADRRELPDAMVNAFAYGPVALIECFVAGTEVAVPVLDDGSGPRALPVVAIKPDGGNLRLHGEVHRRVHRVRRTRAAARRRPGRVRPGRGVRPRGPRAARALALGPDRGRRRHGVVPGGGTSRPVSPRRPWSRSRSRPPAWISARCWPRSSVRRPRATYERPP